MFKKTRKKLKLLSYQHPQATQQVENYLRSYAFGASFFRTICNVLFSLQAKNRLPLNQNHEEYVQRMLNLHQRHIVIMGHEHVAIVIRLIQEKLKLVGISSEVIDKPPEGGFSDAVHIVLCPQAFRALPRNYIAFQMEQLAISDRYRNKRYLDILCNALAVFDYSLMNIEYMIKHGVPKERIFYLPIFSKVRNDFNQNLVYDVLFYGDIHSERRQNLLNKLKKDFNLKIAFKVWGEQKIEELKKAKVIVNLHFYEDALLESTRLFECLEMGKVVVSEESLDQVTYQHLNGIVEFFPAGNYPELKQLLNNLLNNDKLEQQIKNIKQGLDRQLDWFTLYFCRALLALDIISFDSFYEVIGKQIKLSDKVTVRTIEYEAINPDNSLLANNGTVLEALRHYLPEKARDYTYDLIRRNAELLNNPTPHLAFTEQTKRSWM
ncbi:hypothetical protein M3080_03700 [Parasutterella secunda]|uniref:hypothetical protein n=1 Tax=Parasutterella secunda TaxID=626947 RepID=UPI0020117EF7|nr:hypothetical protein [Parasutterella secunda]MCL1596473.1 hypothetical protein [Parasutterella secunda]